MNLKSMFTGVAIAATVVTGTVAMTAPADAATFNFAGKARLESNTLPGQSTLNFRQVPGGFTTPIGTAVETDDFNQFQISDLILNGTSTPWSLSSVVSPFLSGLGIVPNGGSFNLTSFSLSQEAGNFFSGIFAGIFANGTTGAGTFTSQGANFLALDGSSYSGTIDYVPVPTPALLPGLLGLGVAALRKRKGEGSEAENETVGVKA